MFFVNSKKAKKNKDWCKYSHKKKSKLEKI